MFIINVPIKLYTSAYCHNILVGVVQTRNPLLEMAYFCNRLT